MGPPREARATLTRARLLARMRRRWELSLTAVVAGPGFGKTTLLTHAYTENALEPQGLDLWITCEPDHASASLLAQSICRELGSSAPGDEDPAELAHLICDLIATKAPLDVAITLDGIDHLAATTSGAALLCELLAELPANGHVVTSSRRSPAVPLARMVARGEAQRITETELAFTAEELAAFAALREVDVAAFGERGQWPALAELVASEPELVDEYLRDEALTHLPADRRRALAVLAVLDGGDADTVAAVLGEHVDLEELVGDLPLVSRAHDGWITLSTLWHDALVRDLTDAERRDALLRAGRHLSERGQHLRAFRLLARADAWDDALEVVVDVSGATPPAADVLSRWLDDLPADYRTRPEAALLVGIIAKQRGEPAVEALETARAGFERQGNERGEVACLPHLGQLAFWLGDVTVAHRAIARAQELGARGNVLASTLVTIGETVTAQLAGDYQQVLDILGSLPTELLTGPWRVIVDPLRTEALITLGRADEALLIAEGATMFPARADTLPGALWLTGRTVEARQAAREALREAGSAAAQWVQAAATQAARFEAYAGDIEAACSYVERARALGPPSSVVVKGRTAMAEAAIEVARGDEETAAAVLKTALEDEPPVTPSVAWRAQRRALALSYVLMPETRGHWDGDDLGPTFRSLRDQARALVALREQGDDEPCRVLAMEPDMVQAGMPLPWAVELAVATAGLDRPEGRALLDALGAGARPWVARLTTASNRRVSAAAKQLHAELPIEPSAQLELLMLGPIRLHRDGERVDTRDWRRERVRHLLCYLVIHGSATREVLIDALWPELDLAAGANNLRVTLSYLLRVLEPTRKDKEPSYFIRQDKQRLELVGRDHLTTDLAAFEDHIAAADAADRDGAPSLALAHARAAVALWRGPFLADADAIWAELEAERLRARFLDVALRAGELALAAGETDESERLATQVLNIEPWSERSYRLLIAVHLARNDRPAARRGLERCFGMLDDLGVDPEDETRMLERRLVTAEIAKSG